METKAIREELTGAVGHVYKTSDDALAGLPDGESPPHIERFRAHRATVMEFLQRRMADSDDLHAQMHLAKGLATETKSVLPSRGAGAAQFKAAGQAVDRLLDIVNGYLARQPERVVDEVADAVVDALRTSLLPSIGTAVTAAVEAALHPAALPHPPPPPVPASTVTLNGLASFSPADYPTPAAQNAFMQEAIVVVSQAKARGTLSGSLAAQIRARFALAAFNRTPGGTWAEVVGGDRLLKQLPSMLDEAAGSTMTEGI